MPFLVSKSDFQVGENKDLAIDVWDQNDPTTDLSAATATIAAYAEDGTATLASGAATVTGTTTITVSRAWDVSAVTPGEYRAVAAVTYGGKTYNFQWKIRVTPKPAGQL